ncbi:hypothetical protein M2459_001826 [Parabacteroides sp. PF5-5]|uniref:hypothetical protein n=1 Tax=unclassified Parabacteroides TaxID=2649774 RepID=UPI0024739E05|nr:MULTISPECIES: hypothetical protein [unclassified Parabacteroides]MDH6305373.1 hypothetical protein [Parabacteroides sp. PH5-39]MDH6316083.1 hypothetical protein [Parabacteroides sp. PF5-13]MDH6320233.1 hypothetical protein [Parabacteroides sp. PH5-13]MDH6323963.1 hypothetical protein [Parabacteroides sp. PH5-8]MDH6327274.1 hypothetical protein [Parabacteroides sp. PH5-41]
MEVFDNALWIMILVIFGLTALLALASIPDWIKVSEWYKKKLFLALIIEVVALVITYSVGKFTDKGAGDLVPVKVADKETQLTPIPDNSKQFVYVLNNDKDTIGKFSVWHSNLREADIFNYIVKLSSDQGDYKLIKWQQMNNKWTTSLPDSACYIKGCPFYTKIQFFNGLGGYQIYKKGEGTPQYCSNIDDPGIPVVDVDYRRLHLFEYKDEESGEMRYVLFRVTDADFNPDPPKRPYVHILQMRIRPVLQEKRNRQQIS